MKSASLVAITKPAFDSEAIKTPEELIAYCARVSNPSNQLNTETAPKLLRYLIEHKHWSPFEMVSMTVEIKTSRAVAAQILRHRSFSFQEFSQRYSSTSSITDISLRKQADKNRQSSADEIDPLIRLSDDGNYTDETRKASGAVAEHLAASMRLYSELLDAGVAKECARMILPLATETTLYMSGTVRSWIHYLELRTEDDTQLEHRQIALEIKEIFKTEFPDTYDALWGT